VTVAIPLGKDEVHVWLTTCPADHTVGHSAWALLSPDERGAAGRLRDDGDRALHVQARATLRQVLARYVGADPSDLDFERNRHGKPGLVARPGHPALRFNVSHSDTKILLAVTADRELGVDVERIQPEFPWEAVARSLLSSAEIATIRGSPAARQLQMFFDCWVRKEAYVKGLGTGLSASVGDFVVPLGASGGVVHDHRRSSPADAGWRVHPLDVGSGHAAALAVSGKARVSFWRFSDRVSLGEFPKVEAFRPPPARPLRTARR
jgi:4'-phosphopantetheinyl transferase